MRTEMFQSRPRARLAWTLLVAALGSGCVEESTSTPSADAGQRGDRGGEGGAGGAAGEGGAGGAAGEGGAGGVGGAGGGADQGAPPETCLAGEQDTRPCGLNQRGRELRSCVPERARDEEGLWGDWGACADPDVCVDDATDLNGDPCGLNGRGTGDRTCVVGAWQPQDTCSSDPDVCVDGATDADGAPCGLNARGTGDRSCVTGAWRPQGTCSNDPDVCVDGATDTGGAPCGLNTRGTGDRTCVAGAWQPQDTCSNDPDVCVDGATDLNGDPCGLNGRGTGDRTCVAGAWQAQDACSNDPDVCLDGATDTGGPACGINGRGTGDRTCVAGAWQPQDTCSADPDVCVDGAPDRGGAPCGLNGRGTGDRTCVAGAWQQNGTCGNDPDVCADGATDTGGAPCGLNGRGAGDRVCVAGAWRPLDRCDGLDNDCDGETDEDYVPRQTTCGVGACRNSGETVCEDGVELEPCEPLDPLSAADITCDDIDDDCDGEVDEDTSGGTVCLDWVRIEGGRFQMGSNGGRANERPVHGVDVTSFEMARTEVTNAQYQACIAAGACDVLPWDGFLCTVWSGVSWVDGPLPDTFRGPQQPVVCVDWMDARAFSTWVGGRLPSEAEWEYAARNGGMAQTYPWGDEEATCERAVMIRVEGNSSWVGCGMGDHTQPVCSMPAGNTPHGLCDMAGNVGEWVEDCHHDSYDCRRNPQVYGCAGATPRPDDGTAWLGCDVAPRGVRGGSWFSIATQLRAAYRGRGGQNTPSVAQGFRPAR